MKQIYYLVFFLAIFSFQSIAQDSVRIVTNPPRNGHSISKSKGDDKVGLYYVDDEKAPFTGKFIEKGYDGKKKSERNYVNGILEGGYIEWTNRGDSEYIKTKGNYKNGELYGEYTEWWRADHKKKKCFYDLNGELHGEIIHYEGFSVEEPTSIQFYNHGKRDSTWTWFYSGGKVKTIQNYRNGKDHGELIEYYENGTKKEEIKYINDKKEDTHTKWYKDGQLQYTCEFQNGKKSGKEIFYYKNGQVKKEGEYLNGNKKGHFIWYKSDGSIEEETDY